MRPNPHCTIHVEDLEKKGKLSEGCRFKTMSDTHANST